MAGGMFAAFLIYMGLLSRDGGNRGEYLEMPMTDVLSMATGQEWARSVEGEIADDHHRPREDLFQPAHNVYRTSDGEFVSIASVEEKFWSAYSTNSTTQTCPTTSSQRRRGRIRHRRVAR